MYFNPSFRWGPNLSFFGLGPIIHGIAKLEITFISNLMTPFERYLSKLSENCKIVEIGCTEFKLWQLKESPNDLIKREGGGLSFNSHNLVPLIQCENF